MGGFVSKREDISKRIIWCDTEGGVRGVPLWDVTFIDEGPNDSLQAVRFFNVFNAGKQGRLKLRKSLPLNVFATAVKTSCTYLSTHKFDEKGQVQEGDYTPLSKDLTTAVKEYLIDRRGSVLCAWNLKAHDRHVLRNAVGKDVLDKLVLWDALPWFKSNYLLPKNTLSNCKPGTPRSVFKVLQQGTAHTSLADASHLREVVLRASYCLESKDTTASKDVDFSTMFNTAQKEIEKQIDIEEWIPIQPNAWTNPLPLSVLKGEKV